TGRGNGQGPGWCRMTAEPLPDPTPIGSQRARVLLAVATPLRALGLKAALRDVAGVRVAWACHAVEAALADARRVLPQVILADLHLPGGGAAALCRALLQELPETRVVILAPDAGESALLE